MDMNATHKTDPTANREYKDSVFTLLFGNEETVKEVYGAIKGTTYGPDTKVEISTLKNTLYHGKINDLSFVLDGKLIVLIEHQSTLSENMPLRMLFYIAELYDIHVKDKNIYKKTKLPLPTPEFIVLYNGTQKMPGNMRILKLSDTFIEHDPSKPPNLELTVKMYNINKGRNKKIQKRCATLREYGIFVDMARRYEKTMSREEAIWKAMNDCIDQNVLKKFLVKNRRKVANMYLREWNLETALKFEREEGWEDGVEAGMKKGMQKGMQKGILQTAKAMLADDVDVDTVAKWTGLTVDDVLRL